jgi:homoserine dehydrogenase
VAGPTRERTAVSERSDVCVAVFGLGGIGVAFLELLSERDIHVRLTGVADSRGAVTGDLDPRAVIELKRAGSLPAEIPHADVVKLAEPNVVVEVMSCDFATGEPALSVILEAFGHGAHVVTANKAPLARRWADIQDAAARAGKRLGYVSAAGAALPAVAVARSLGRADVIDAFEGVLTGTTTFILDEMANGTPFGDAVRRAQEGGIAEPDPSVDISGWDTAAKVVILANTMWGTAHSLDDVAITGLSENLAVAGDGPLRLVGSARRDGELVVEPRRFAPDHPLSGLRGRDKGVVFLGPSVGQVMVAGGRSHPRGAAAAVLGDVLEVGAL